MAEAFAALGHEVTLAHPAFRENALTPDLLGNFYGIRTLFGCHPIQWRSFPPPRHVFQGSRMGKLAVAGGYELSYGQDIFSAAACATRGIPTVFDAHKFWPAGRLHWWAFRRMLHSDSFRGITASSRALRDRFVTAFPQLEGRAAVAWNASDAEPPCRPVDLPRRELSVGYMGHLYAGKGVEVVVGLARQCPWASFHVIGGENSDVQHWEQALQSESLANLAFYGFRPPAELAAYRAACDVLLVPYQRAVRTAGGTLQDGDTIAPMKLIEAMGAGKAVVASGLTVAREIVRHGENGLLAAPDDISAWVAALESLRDPGLRTRLGDAARADHAARLTWQARARTTLALLDTELLVAEGAV